MPRFLFCIAGLPRSTLDEAIRHQRRIVGKCAEIVGRPLDAAAYAPQPRYEKGYARSLAELIYRKVEPLLETRDADTHVCLIYLDYGSATNDNLYDAIFPACMLAPLAPPSRTDCQPGSSQWSDLVLNSIGNAVQSIRSASRAIFNQVQSNANKTPLLLPVRNFRSEHLRGFLRSVNASVLSAQDSESALRSLENSFVVRHPRMRWGTSSKPCFVDERQIGFVPPGTARHGYVRSLTEPHRLDCVLSSMFRLGAPYDRRYHFDCQIQDGTGAIRGSFTNCHDVVGLYRGEPHLNIACNDAIRGKQIGG